MNDLAFLYIPYLLRLSKLQLPVMRLSCKIGLQLLLIAVVPAKDGIFVGALTIGMVADLARGANGVAVAWLARPLVAEGTLLVAEVTLPAVVTEHFPCKYS